jgi:hypothetical protein
MGDAAYTPRLNLPERRRKELLAGLLSHKAELVTLLASLLAQTWAEVSAQPQQPQRTALSACVEALSVFTDKLPFELLQQHRIPQWLAQLAAAPAVAGDIHEVIINLVCRKYTANAQFVDEIAELWAAVLRCAAGAIAGHQRAQQQQRQGGAGTLDLRSLNQQEKTVQLLLKTVRALKVFLLSHSQLVRDALAKAGRVGPDAGQHADRRLAAARSLSLGTLQTLCGVLGTGSLQLEGEALACLVELYRVHHDTYLADPATAEGCSRELLSRLAALAGKRTEEDYDWEFDSSGAFTLAAAQTRVQSLALAAQLAQRAPVLTVSVLGEQTFAALKALREAPVAFSRPPTRDSFPPYDPELNALIAPHVVGSDAALGADAQRLEALASLLDHAYRAIDQALFGPAAEAKAGAEAPAETQAAAQAKARIVELTEVRPLPLAD